MKRLLLVVVAVALVPALARAEVYYVDPAGADSAAGSSDAPWATLQHAADTVAPGDEVRVRAGSYAGFVLRTSGVSGARISFSAEPGVVIDSDSGEQGSGVHLVNVSYVTVEGFRIESVSGRGIAHRGATADSPVRGLEIRNNVIQSAGREGMYLSQVADSLVEANTIADSGASGADRTHGIYLANGGSDGTTFRANHIYGSGTAGIHFNGDLSIGGDGIITGVTIESNLIHDNGQNGLNMDGVQDALVRNNVIYGNASNGLRAYVIDGAEGPRGLTVVNNTFHVPSGGGWCVRITDDLGSLIVFNNILMNDHSSNGSIALNRTDGLASANNAVVDSFTPDRDATYLGLSEWQALGFDEGSFLAMPSELFVDFGVGDYHPRPGAPSIDRGLASFRGVNAPPFDTDGVGRPVGGTVDIGAYERCEAAACAETDAGPRPPDAGPRPPDAGAGSDAGSGGGDGSVARDAGAGGASDGCACRASSSGPGSVPVWIIALAAFAVVRARRRR